MAFNPFLSSAEPGPAAPAEVLNPFMTGDAEPAPFAGDNPFAASNPFADFGFEPAAGDEVPADMFGAPHPPTGAGAAFPPPACKPTALGPLPPGTHDLILSVTGQMEFASSHLLDRIPPTRTPSPVSARDIHSPSPTPDPEAELELDPEPARPPGGDAFDINRNKPPRPPPARPGAPPARAPPPRPAPPPVLAPQPAPQPAPPAADDINLFDAPVPASVKPTKEAILSLYSTPRKEEERPIDFLSDDIPEQGAGSPFAALADEPSRRPSEVERNPFESAAGEDAAASPFNEPNVFALSPSEAAFGAATAEAPSPAGAFDRPLNADAFESVSSANAFEITSTSNVFEATTVGDDRSKSTQNDHEKTVPDAFDAAMPDSSMNFTAPSDGAFETASNTNIFETAPAANMFEAASSADVHEPAAKADTFETSSSTNVFESASSVNIFETGSSADMFENASSANVFEESLIDNAFGTTSIPNAFESSSNGMDAFESPPDAQLAAGGPEPSEMQCDSAAPPATGSPFDAGGDGAFAAAGWGAAPQPMNLDPFPESQDAFDAFSAKFDSTAANHLTTGAWGDDASSAGEDGGFEAEAFDTFLSMSASPPHAVTPLLRRDGSADSADDTFSVFIRPKEGEGAPGPTAPALAPPPRPAPPPDSPRANPFDRSVAPPAALPHPPEGAEGARPGSGGETPPTPLFDEDVSVPLEEFPRTRCSVPGWEMQLRQPNKKKITGQRFWKKVFVRLAYQGDNPVVQLFNAAGDKEPFQELPLQACYSVSEVGAQQFDQFGKIFTVKLQYVFYKERPGVRPGQVTKAERITNKLSQFAAYAIQGDYQGVKEFGSDLRKLGLPVEHAPQVSQLFKLGSLAYEDVKQFSCCVEEALFRLPAHRDRALHYKMEEVQVTAVDELYVEQDADGAVLKQIARVRLFFLGFLSGMPDVELGVNDLRRQGKEVVGRHDIIPVVTEEWIRVEDAEFHACVQPDEFTATQIIKFKPPDACYIELMRFRVRPPKNRELPLQLKAVWCVTGNKVELRADVLVPGFASRKLGQVPCEDVAIRFPIPECWIYLFRVEKHFRYGSVKSAHRRTGKIKGIERFLGAVDTLQESLIEVTSGQAKYEHQHRAIVWRMPRLPKEGQGAYTTHNLVCRMALTSYDQVPEELARWAHVEFTMPATQVSHMTVRSVSLQNHDSDPPEKYVRYLARHEYIVGIERTSGQAAPAYALAATTERAEPAPPPAPAAPQPPSSDSDSE